MTTTSDSTTTQLLDGTARQSANRQPKWVAPVVIAALLVGGAGLGVGAVAVATTPAKTSGPQAARDRRDRRPRTAGRQGSRWPRRTRRPDWDDRRHPILSATSLKSAPDPAVGTVLVAKTSCPLGKILLNGGAQVTAPGVLADRNVTLRSSFPINSTNGRRLRS